MRWAVRLMGWTLLALLAAGLLWAAAAVSLGLVRSGGDLGDPDGEVTVLVVSNGWHASLVLPVQAAGHDWRTVMTPPQAAPYAAVMFGWGDRNFYRTVRTMADFDPRLGLAAIAALGEPVLHVAWLPAGLGFADMVPVQLNTERYQRLVRFIAASIRDGAPEDLGYGPDHRFLPATGRYSLFRTCNEWTAEALRTAGIATPLWTPLPQALMRALRQG